MDSALCWTTVPEHMGLFGVWRTYPVLLHRRTLNCSPPTSKKKKKKNLVIYATLYPILFFCTWIFNLGKTYIAFCYSICCLHRYININFFVSSTMSWFYNHYDLSFTNSPSHKWGLWKSHPILSWVLWHLSFAVCCPVVGRCVHYHPL